jgi:tRNA (cytidine56-2'-O)-methyltransferase
MLLVLRLGHRLPRDERITTHVALVARAFGANGMIYSGQHDSSLESSIISVVEQWGGSFSIKYEKNYVDLIKEYKKNGFTVCHLTMYGIPLPEKIAEIKKSKNILVIVGAEKVPRDVYELADYNIAITSQPHSEVAALAVFLNELNDGKALEREFDKQFNGKLKIKPSERGKIIS